ncbi:Putative signal peptide peptidase SppA [bacterium HR10]|nr:Putative signal peptide peptidase SppA [bacterium HR10]
MMWPFRRRRKKNRVAVVAIEGIITDTSFGASREHILQALERVEEMKARALVVRINSPGGTVGACQEIHQAIRRLRQNRRIPVVASLGDVAASGGLYVAVACQKIVANPGTITGSIGVVLKANNLRGLYQKLGVESEVIKSGPYKDALSTFRPLTEEERALLQEVIDDTYAQFVDAVADGRGLSSESVRTIADGRIFTGQQAKAYGLVDELGNVQRAVELAAEMAGIVGKPVVVEAMPRKRRGLLARLFTRWRIFPEDAVLLTALRGLPLWLMPI